MIDTVVLLPASLAICAYTLAYTPANSKLRPLAGLTIAVFNWYAAQSKISNWFPGFIGPEYILGWILASNNWLNLARVEYKPSAKGYEKPGSRLRWGINHVFDTRWSVHPSQVPPFDKNRPQWVPSKRYFLLWKIWTCTWCSALIYAMHKFEPLELDDLTSTPVGFLYRLGDMSTREIWLRAYYGFGVMIDSYCCLCLMHAACGFIAVLVFNDDPAGWRPLHGSPLSALGMRGFYRTFWHHCMRKGFTTHAVFLVNDVLRLPRKNPISRYLIVALSFLISGLYHAALTPDLPLKCALQQVNYQTKVIGAVIIEDVVSLVWSKFAPRSWQLEGEQQTIENDSATKSKTSALTNGSSKSELRRRNGKTSDRDYPKSPMPMTLMKAQRPGLSSDKMVWKKIVLHGLAYLWTAFFLIYANSTLVYGTNKCVVEHIWSTADQEEYFQSHGFNEPI